MYQPYPSSGQPAEPLPSPTPAPVRTAVKVMYAGAAVWAVNLISGLVFIIDGSKAGHAIVNGHVLTAAQASQLHPVLITVAIVFGLVVIALWLWMARANGRGRNWARILFTVLSGPAALTLIFPQFVIVPQWVPLIGNNPLVIGFVPFAPIPFVPGAGPIGPVLTGLVSLAAVCLLWLPASSAYFRPSPRYLQALQQAHRMEAARIRSSGRRFQRLM